MGEKGDEQRLYIMDSNGVPLGYVFMGGDILYSMEGKRISEVSEDVTIGELKKILLREKTLYIA
jgi:hypothetical protein